MKKKNFVILSLMFAVASIMVGGCVAGYVEESEGAVAQLEEPEEMVAEVAIPADEMPLQSTTGAEPESLHTYCYPEPQTKRWVCWDGDAKPENVVAPDFQTEAVAVLTVYEHWSFGGASRTLSFPSSACSSSNSDIDFTVDNISNLWSGWNDRISSFHTHGGRCIIKFYQSYGPSGASTSWMVEEDALTGSWNDAISAFELT